MLNSLKGILFHLLYTIPAVMIFIFFSKEIVDKKKDKSKTQNFA